MKCIKKYFSMAVIFLLSVFVLCGCGATIDTKLEANKEFAGTRTINVNIKKSDISEYVTGGEAALTQVIDSNIPKEMSYSVNSGETDMIITFLIEFQNVSDYTEKVNNIISAGSNEEIQPEIQYDNKDTYFKKGLYFEENFTSKDLLQWYYDALDQAQIISEKSQSDWASLGDSKCIIDGTEYNVYSKMSVDEQECCCVDSLEVETTLNIDGTITREFCIGAYDTTIEELEERGCVLGEYFKNLAQEEEVSFVEMRSEDDGYTEYRIIVKAQDSGELVKKTNKILQSDNAFSLEIKNNEEVLGMAKVNVTERLDGSYYLDYRHGNDLKSILNTYVNSSMAGDVDTYSNMSLSYSEDQLEYWPSNTLTSEFAFDWKIGFSSIEMEADINSKDSIKVSFIFTINDLLNDELKQASIQALKQSCGEYGEFKESEDKCVLSFSGKISDVSKEINEFLKSNDNEPEEEKEYFSVEKLTAQTLSRFYNNYAVSINYDLSPIIGRQQVVFCNTENIYNKVNYNGQFIQNTDDGGVMTSADSVLITQHRLSILTLGVCTVGLICLVFGLLMFIKELKNVKVDLAGKKRKKVINAEADTVSEQVERDEIQIAPESDDNQLMEDEIL